MARALGRLVSITLLSVILLFSGLFFMRWVGLRQVFQAPPHPWFKNNYWRIYKPSKSEACQPQVPEGWAVYLHVFKKDGEWLADCSIPTPLDQVLSRSRQRDWLLAVEGKETGKLDIFVKIVAAHDKEKTFAIHARSQIIARYLRKKSPQWIYAADTASLLKLHLFSGLWLETAMDFWPDFVIASEADAATGGRLSSREVDELNRRDRKIIWDDDGQRATPPFVVQGILTNRIP